MEREAINKVNELYRELELKKAKIVSAIFRGAFEIDSGWYSGHYRKDENGKLVIDAYPIPVVSVKGLCDIEVSFDGVSLTTKLKREDALSYSYDKIMGREFEAFGTEDYLNSFYEEGKTIEELKSNVSKSEEKEISFAFKIPEETGKDELYEFLKLLKKEGFYY